MKIAVLSDIHGNMDAFEQVLADIDGRGVASVLSLGDNIGYGAEPERVVQTLKAHGILSVLGNHELAAKKPSFLGWFNPTARKSLAMTFRMLSADSMVFIAGLPDYRVIHGCRLVHGFRRTPPPSTCFRYCRRTSRKRCRTFRSASVSSATPTFWTWSVTMARACERRLQRRRQPSRPGLAVSGQHRQRGPTQRRGPPGEIRDMGPC